MARHAEVANSEVVQRVIPALAELAGLIGDPEVRNRGTLGGSVGNNDPAADYPGAVLGLGATVSTNKREITGDDFFTGMFETALEPGEIVTAVHFPRPDKADYEKFRQPGLALRHGRRVRRQHRRPGARRGDRRGPDRRSAATDGAGAGQSFSPAALDEHHRGAETSTATSMPAPSTAPTSSRSWPSARSRRWRRGSGREGARPPPAPTLRCSLSLTSGPKLWWR